MDMYLDPFFNILRAVVWHSFGEHFMETRAERDDELKILLGLVLNRKKEVEYGRHLSPDTVRSAQKRALSTPARFRTSPSNAHRSRSMYSPGGDSSIPFSISCGP
jgi:hypothetical protein